MTDLHGEIMTCKVNRSWEKKMAGTLNACIAGFALLCYVLGLLASEPQIPLTMNVIFPKMSGECGCSLMALLGANIMAHNFYIHSSVFIQQRGKAMEDNFVERMRNIQLEEEIMCNPLAQGLPYTSDEPEVSIRITNGA